MSPHAGEAAPVQRLRIDFAIHGPARYIGNLDLTRGWVRALRRLQVPLSYSHGFNPHARLTIAAPLAVGFAGERELLEVYFDAPQDPAQLGRRLAQQLPPGLTLLDVAEIPLAGPALAAQIRASDYVVSWRIAPPAIALHLQAVLAATSLPYVRRRGGKEVRFDLRPRILQAALRREGEGAQLTLRLAYGPSGAARPEDVLEAMGIGVAGTCITRTGLILDG